MYTVIFLHNNVSKGVFMKSLRYFSIVYLLINASALSAMGGLNETLGDGSNPGIIAKSSSYGQEQLDKHLQKKQTAAKTLEEKRKEYKNFNDAVKSFASPLHSYLAENKQAKVKDICQAIRSGKLHVSHFYKKDALAKLGAISESFPLRDWWHKERSNCTF
jgi:anti-sigma28 factor (negative regulator of flagellin synthesis)